MSKYKSNLVYLDNILEAIEHIQLYVAEKTFGDYQNTAQMADAIHMRLQLIGENCSKLDVRLRDKYLSIPWIKIRSLRHIISHDYNILVPEVIWETIQSDLPELKSVIEEMISEEEFQEKS